MLGHKLWQLSQKNLETYVTLRRPLSTYRYASLFDPSRVISGVDADHFETVVQAIKKVKPDVVVNCLGVVKQRDNAKDPLIGIRLNSLFPHQLKEICGEEKVRLIHMSTDCIFSGKKGNYREEDPSDAEDLYGKTKYLGELDGKGCLTLRTSIIGRELDNRLGLVEWLLSQNGKTVRGYRKAIYSGFTTLELSRIILSLIQDFPELSGIYHVARAPINKYDLLQRLVKAFGLKVEIQPYDDFSCDRSLNASRFQKATSLVFPGFEQMVNELAQDAETNKEYYGGVR
jgi:dTDP-4-dehydrorhamnose reductase